MIFVFTYVIAATFGPRLDRAEFYPFFNWSLFTFTHSLRSEVVIIVHSINGEPLASPSIYFDLPDKLANYPGGKIRLQKLLGDFQKAVDQSDRERVEYLIDLIAKNYFSKFNNSEFTINTILYNPIVRYKTGTYKIIKILKKAKV